MATKASGVSQQPFEEIVAEHGPTGTIKHYVGGVEAKHLLLALESAA